MQASSSLKIVLLFVSSLLLANCSPTLGVEHDENGIVNIPDPQDGLETEEPIALEPTTIRCDFLVDKTGAYFSIGQQKAHYLAIQGITECAFNQLNKIPGPCNPDVQLTVLKPDDIPNSTQDDLLLSPHHEFSFLPDNGGAQFLCLSIQGQVLISTGEFKVLFIDRKN